MKKRINCDVFALPNTTVNVEIAIEGNFYAAAGFCGEYIDTGGYTILEQCSSVALIQADGDVVISDNAAVGTISAKGEVQLGDNVHVQRIHAKSCSAGYNTIAEDIMTVDGEIKVDSLVAENISSSDDVFIGDDSYVETIVSNKDVTVGYNAKIKSIDAGRDVTIEGDSTVGEITTNGDVYLRNFVKTDTISTCRDFSCGENCIIEKLIKLRYAFIGPKSTCKSIRNLRKA